MLDGATAFVSVPVSAQTYADHLGRSWPTSSPSTSATPRRGHPPDRHSAQPPAGRIPVLQCRSHLQLRPGGPGRLQPQQLGSSSHGPINSDRYGSHSRMLWQSIRPDFAMSLTEAFMVRMKRVLLKSSASLFSI